ncbi:hypothetical protein [Microbispora sp. GKU 823]|uniref:hypothetical protein n=1 Tax=Microbispora sp. GKU 823 TaxID=1652100 RepID=UPI0009A36015|nr:hypothetical protein [Microbispora sp. GKU 823]OPG10566.1 hypothetical protein B1L11_23180 [Microbispora sp. GKU 823]
MFLLLLAYLDLVSAIRFAWPSPDVLHTPSYAFLAELAPLWVWAVLWAGVGALCLVQAFVKRDAIAFGFAAALKFLWAAIYLIAWALDEVPQAYVTVTFWAFAALVVHVISTWPEIPKGDQ